ncbi:MAG: type III PLP-dependent enzyme, partial [Spirochaetales bacterium]
MTTLEEHYSDLEKYFPYARVHYAVKANPSRPVLEMLRDRGGSFDIASIYELDRVLALGVSADRISYGNTIKKSEHIRKFYEAGVRLFATD